MSEKFQRLETRAWRFAGIALAFIYLVTVPRAWQCEGVDEIEYLALAHSLSAGMGYSIYGQPHVLYPPLYPLALSVPWRLADGVTWPLLYGMNAAFGAAGLVLLGLWLRRAAGSAGRWASWLLLTAYYPWSFSTRYLLSEPLFLLLSAALLVLVESARARPRLSVGLLALGGLLAAMASLTRFAAITLLAGVALSLLLDALRRRARGLALLALLVGGVGLAVPIAWELRAQRLDPQARESYGKWVQALAGSGGAEARSLAARTGEGVRERTSWPERVVLTGVKTGQFLLSVPRVSGHFEPVALVLFGLALWGLACRFRHDPASPVAWYVSLTLLMITTTSWVSSYHRYLYPLAPFLFLFAVEGAQSLWSKRGRVVRTAAILVAMAGLAWWMRRGWPEPAGGHEGVYTAALAWIAALLLLGLLAVAVRPPARAPVVLGAAFVLGLSLHNAGLAVLRFRQTLRDATPAARDLLGYRQACEWLRKNAAPGDSVVASQPIVASFLLGRVASAPAYGSAGDWQVDAGAWVVTSGPLRDFPAYRPEVDGRLEGAATARGASRVFSSGGAAVYRVGVP